MATVGRVDHTLVAVDVGKQVVVHRNNNQLDGLEVVVQGAAQVEEGYQDTLNYQDEHDWPQLVVQG